MNSKPSEPDKAEPMLPGVEVRTIVSFLIFVHFFALFAAVVYTRGASSDLAQKFANLPVLRQYRQLLDMNLPYTYQLTFGEEPDYRIEADLEFADGKRERVLLPPVAHLRPGIRQRRLEALASNVSSELGNDLTESILPQGITAG